MNHLRVIWGGGDIPDSSPRIIYGRGWAFVMYRHPPAECTCEAKLNEEFTYVPNPNAYVDGARMDVAWVGDYWFDVSCVDVAWADDARADVSRADDARADFANADCARLDYIWVDVPWWAMRVWMLRGWMFRMWAICGRMFIGG